MCSTHCRYYSPTEFNVGPFNLTESHYSKDREYRIFTTLPSNSIIIAIDTFRKSIATRTPIDKVRPMSPQSPFHTLHESWHPLGAKVASGAARGRCQPSVNRRSVFRRMFAVKITIRTEDQRPGRLREFPGRRPSRRAQPVSMASKTLSAVASSRELPRKDGVCFTVRPCFRVRAERACSCKRWCA